MANRNKTRAHQPPPSQSAQKQADATRKKKQFIKELMQSPQLTVFTGKGKLSHWGFAGNADFLLFLLLEVYDWDGTNSMFKKILAGITGKQPEVAERDETDALLDEIEQETTQEERPELQDYDPDPDPDDAQSVVDMANLEDDEDAQREFEDVKMSSIREHIAERTEGDIDRAQRMKELQQQMLKLEKEEEQASVTPLQRPVPLQKIQKKSPRH